MTGGRAGQASEAAVEAGAKAHAADMGYVGWGAVCSADRAALKDVADVHLRAAHDPALGLERSVRLGDVVEALEELASEGYSVDSELGDFIERRFTGEADDGN